MARSWFRGKEGIPFLSRIAGLQWYARLLTRKLRQQWRFTTRWVKLAILFPVDGHCRDLGRVLPEHPFQHFQRLPGRHAPDSHERQARGETLPSNGIRKTQLGPGAPVHAEARLALCSSMMRQSVEEGVGSSIVAL